MMEPKILLVNFTQSEADTVHKDTGLKVLRGYLGESQGIVGAGSARRQMINFYSPEAFYECAMVFIKVPASDKLKEEFHELAKELVEEDGQNFHNYWTKRGRLLVFFVGDTNISSLWHFRIPVRLIESSGNDTSTKTWMGADHELHEVSELINNNTKMPTARYIESGFKEDENGRNLFYAFGTSWTTYLSNVNQDALSIALSKSNDDYSNTDPGAFVLGLPKKVSTITTKMIKFFGEYFEIFAVGNDWKKSDEFFPADIINGLKQQRDDIVKEAKKNFDAKTQEIDDLKDKYAYLVDLVTEQGLPLVRAVKKTLEEVIGLEVIDSDEVNEGEPIEDLFITLNTDRQISVEVKGTTKPTPPLEYTQQPFQHITRRGYGSTVEAALILNHDMNKYPPQRTNAYNETDKEPLIANLHFIDTRVLLKVANDVIDGAITEKEGAEILFNKMGRITYSPEEIAKASKGKPEEASEVDTEKK